MRCHSICTLLLLVAASPALALPVTPGQGVTFQQLAFPFAFPPESSSQYGRVDVDMVALSTATGLSSGYVNVRTSTGWVVQNLPVFLDLYGYEAVQTTFRLPSASPMTSLTAVVEYTGAPQLGFGATPTDVFAVTLANHAVGGFGDAANLVAGPMPAPPPAGAIAFQIGGVINVCLQLPLHTNLETAFNQCAPMAVACNFDWLRAHHGINLQDLHQVGLGRISGIPAPNNDCRTLVGELDVTMGRTITPNSPGGVNPRRFGLGVSELANIMGKLSYMSQGAANLRGLVVKHQTWNLMSCLCPVYSPGAGITICGLASAVAAGQANGAPTFTFIHDEICHDEAVELVYMLLVANPMGMAPCTFSVRGAHAVQVVASGRVLGVPYIFHRSDQDQTNDAAGTRGVQFCFLLDDVFTGGFNIASMSNMFGEPGTPEVGSVVTQSPPEQTSIEADENWTENFEVRVRPNPSLRDRIVEVEFDLPRAMAIRVMVYDVTGREVARLLEGERAAGPQRATWNGVSQTGARVAAGVYFIRYETAAGIRAQRVVRIE